MLTRKPEVVSKVVRIDSKELLARLLLLNGEEGMLSTHLADIVNISQSGLRKHIRTYAISAQPLDAHSMRSLKDLDVIPIHAKTAVFLPKESIHTLIKVIDTDEAWAIYRQLWDDAAELAKARILLAESLELTDSLKIKIADLTAKLEAATHHISLGGNKRAPRFAIPIYRREPNDIFDNPVYTVEVVKKPVSHMSKAERGKFRLYHCSKTIVGLSAKMVKDLTDSHVTNHDITERAEQLCAIAKALNNDITPRSLLS